MASLVAHHMVKRFVIDQPPQQALIAIPLTFLILATGIVPLRIYARRLKKLSLGADDFLCIAALICHGPISSRCTLPSSVHTDDRTDVGFCQSSSRYCISCCSRRWAGSDGGHVDPGSHANLLQVCRPHCEPDGVNARVHVCLIAIQTLVADYLI